MSEILPPDEFRVAVARLANEMGDAFKPAWEDQDPAIIMFACMALAARVAALTLSPDAPAEVTEGITQSFARQFALCRRELALKREAEGNA